MLEAQDAVATEIRENLEEGGHRLGIDITFMERTGSPLNEIARVADELRVDAVVVGASMQAGHRFIGAIATRLVRVARWPVTVVP
jgi:nucleotide-binding universal stress UspA family protein